MKKFTLIELLIVVAIIGILLSILLPSLNKARQASHKVVCMSNLKQHGVALLHYHKDNMYFFPLMQTGQHRYGWAGETGKTETIYGNRRSKAKKRLLNYYFVENVTNDLKMDVFKCGSDAKSSNTYSERGSSYSANTSSNGQGIRNTLNRGATDSYNLFKHIKSPDRIITMGELGGFKSAMNNGSVPEAWYWHSGQLKFNMLNGDNAVRFFHIPLGSQNNDTYVFSRDK